MAAKEYFDTEYDKEHIKTVVDLKDLESLYALMEEYADRQLRLNLSLNVDSVSTRFDDPKFIDNVCVSYRHDFGMLLESHQDKVRFECSEWMRAIKNNEPY